MKPTEAIILAALVLGALWLRMRPTAQAGINPLDLSQPPPYDPNPVNFTPRVELPPPIVVNGTPPPMPGDLCAAYCRGEIQFFMNPNCNCQGTRRIQI